MKTTWPSTPNPQTYRLVPAQYETHLYNSDDPDPESTMTTVRAAAGAPITEGSHATARYDAGWYWLTTTTLRVAIRKDDDGLHHLPLPLPGGSAE